MGTLYDLATKRFGALAAHLVLVAAAKGWPPERFDRELTRGIRTICKRLGGLTLP